MNRYYWYIVYVLTRKELLGHFKVMKLFEIFEMKTGAIILKESKTKILEQNSKQTSLYLMTP